MSILTQVVNEHRVGEQYFYKKRSQYRERIRKRNNQSKKKINITMIANHIDTLISSSYTDAPTVKFISRDGFFGKEQAEQLTYIARFDQDDQGYGQLYYQKEQDRYFFGLSIRLQVGWNDQKKSPNFVCISPLSWVADPLPSQTGNFGANEYRFHGFTMRSNILELKNSGQYSKEALNKIVRDYADTQEELNKQAYNTSYNYQDMSIDNLSENFSVEIYHHFTVYEGKKHMVTTSGDRSVLLRDIELKAILKEEKENPSIIPRPVALNYWKPQRGNPFGESVCDYLENKQDAVNILANLSVIKAKKEALGGRFIMNSRLIKNKEDVLNPSVDTQYIRIDEQQIQPGENIQNAAYELPQPTVKTDVFSITQYLDSEAQKATGIDSLQRGVVPDKSMTKAEAQQIQANANLISIRDAKVNGRGDKDFWFLRWRAYQEFLSPRDKKFVILDDNFEEDIFEFGRDSFTYKEMPYIKTGLKSDLDALDEKRKQFLSLYIPQVKQDPTKKQLTKDELEREFLRLNGYSLNQVNTMVPLSKDERIMLNEYIPMINADVMPKGMFERIDDMFTAYIYTQKATDTDTKTIILGTLQSIMTEQDMQGDMQALGGGGAANSASNIQMSQAAQQTQGEELQTRGSALPN